LTFPPVARLWLAFAWPAPRANRHRVASRPFFAYRSYDAPKTTVKLFILNTLQTM